ncbi:flavohemoglobin expression-modulating QEGLA motif protein [Colwellia sp. 12G3]|uniref:flavohemoglobin expression-modulating QEGLA motif protein n=1 Tax=Colwellia sp. 12G3 TaxID=2058299 RepID=UPI000C33A0CF|nr:flavohemoglobin expression-modulating QEGLA motif protein [Colwellia sp. 12G3]PKI16778.1 flavohemoglobin expression-modulating QEGLA motif protein [Colwellia sp. 12G3]
MNFNVDPLLNSIDSQLHSLVKNIDIIEAVKPLNYLQEKERFFTNHFSNEPAFIYKENNINPFELKRSLFNLPLEQIQDEDLYTLYLAVIDSYIDKIDQYKSIGTNEFLYDSLRYYGEPSEKDIHNAQFILHIPEKQNDNLGKMYLAPEIIAIMTKMAEQEKYSWQVELDNTMVANALVSGTTVRINSAAKLSKKEAYALAHHELGVHLSTSLNAQKQPLNILSLGCPLNTMTQEGLAILSEYLSGNLTLRRLRILALRVLAVKSLIEDKNFRTTFLLLKETYHVEDELAYTITARVYRGGGYTKDYLYLKGFSLILNAYEHEKNFEHLLIGKTSLSYLPLITRLIEKQQFVEAHFLPPAYKEPVKNDPENTFIIHGIR